MKERLTDLALGGLAGFVLAAALSLTCFDRQMRALQDYTHHVATSAAVITAHVRANADSLRHRSDSLLRARQPVILRATLATTDAGQLERSLADQRTTADSNLVLRAENRALRQVAVNLWEALQQSNLVIAAERARGDSLDKTLGDVNLRLQGLAARVEQLRPPPNWLRISWEVVKIGGAAYGGYQLGKHDRCKGSGC